MPRSSPYAHLFGPVPSRRLGVSLGIDVVPFKTCSLNCAYCECGPTTHLTTERREYVPLGELVSEIDELLAGSPALDVVTFSGSGEPTLNSRIGDIIAHLKARHSRYKVAVLTNGTLLWLPEVRRAIGPADFVMPSLDAVSQATFEKLNRPAPGLTAGQLIEGIAAFSHEYGGVLYVEVFIVPGINDTKEELDLVKRALSDIRPARVQLNTLDRPCACAWIRPATGERLREIAAYLSPLPVEIISRRIAAEVPSPDPALDMEQAILSALRRRPCTLDDLATVCGSKAETVRAVVDGLLKSSRIAEQEVGGNAFFTLTRSRG